MKWLRIYLICLILFIITDLFWLGILATNFYMAHIGFLMKKNILWLAAFCFYLMYAAAICYFAVNPSLEKNNFKIAMRSGFFLGLVSYGTYDLTNLATIEGWPLKIVWVDMIWGASITAIISMMCHFLAPKSSTK
ncbi:MAG: DUF2177 family protein [Verrucomicrobia bacterium]|nr:DUF2177 family protein [Verrucomicrobiota bacterium]